MSGPQGFEKDKNVTEKKRQQTALRAQGPVDGDLEEVHHVPGPWPAQLRIGRQTHYHSDEPRCVVSAVSQYRVQHE